MTKKLHRIALRKGEKAAQELQEAYRKLVQITRSSCAQAKLVSRALRDRTDSHSWRLADYLEHFIPLLERGIILRSISPRGYRTKDDASLEKRNEVLEVVRETPGVRVGAIPQRSAHELRLRATRAGDLDELAVCFLELLGGLLALAQRYPVELLRHRRLTLRLRVRNASLPKKWEASSPSTFFARLSSRLTTLTPSPSRRLSVG